MVSIKWAFHESLTTLLPLCPMLSAAARRPLPSAEPRGLLDVLPRRNFVFTPLSPSFYEPVSIDLGMCQICLSLSVSLSPVPCVIFSLFGFLMFVLRRYIRDKELNGQQYMRVLPTGTLSCVLLVSPSSPSSIVPSHMFSMYYFLSLCLTLSLSHTYIYI